MQIFPCCFEPHYESEAKRKAFYVKMNDFYTVNSSELLKNYYFYAKMTIALHKDH